MFYPVASGFIWPSITMNEVIEAIFILSFSCFHVRVDPKLCHTNDEILVKKTWILVDLGRPGPQHAIDLNSHSGIQSVWVKQEVEEEW